MMTQTVFAFIVIPIAIFVIGGAAAAIRGAIRFAQYMVRSEEAQESIAKSNKEIRDRLDGFIMRAEDDIRTLNERMAVVEYAQAIRREQHHPAKGHA